MAPRVEDNGRELKFAAADVRGESVFVVDEALAPLADAGGSFFPFKDGYVEARLTDDSSDVLFWPLFADKPVPLFSVPFELRALTADPQRDRQAFIGFLPKTGETFPWGDLYVWSKRDGLKRLLPTTPAQRIGLRTVAWTADGRWLAVIATTPDCPQQEWDPVERRGSGPIVNRSCDRLLLVDSQTGRVGYRTPAALDPLYVDDSTGTVLIASSRLGKDRELILGNGSGLVPDLWWQLDVPALTLARGEPPTLTSPDGQYRAREEGWKTRITTSDNSRNYVVDRFLSGSPAWFGPHHLALRAYVPNGAAWLPDIVLDLATQRAEPLWPDGYREASLSHDAASAVLQRGRGASFERRWARRRYGNGN